MAQSSAARKAGSARHDFDSVSSGDVTFDSGRGHDERRGSGTPVVFIHGWTYTLQTWDAIVPTVIDAGFETIRYDLRGHGGSDNPSGPYDFDALVADLERLLTELELTRPILCGHSVGGMIALNHALRHPDELAGIVLASTAPAARDADVQLDAQFGDYTPETADLEPWWSILAPMLYSDAYRKTDPPELAQTRCRFVHADRAGLANLFHAVAHRRDVTPQLSTVRVPTLIVAGELDPLWPPAAQVEVADSIPSARLAIIPDAGHLVMEEQPAAFAAAVLPFLGSCRTDTA